MRLRVLLVDDDTNASTVRARDLAADGHEVLRAKTLADAAEVLMREPVDSIVCSDALRAEVERAYAAILPVIPAGTESTAVLAKTLARISRRSVSPTVQLSLAAQFDAALAESTLALEPVVDLRDGSVHAQRGELRAPRLAHDDVLAMAADLGRTLELRRTVRRLAADAIRESRASRLMLDCTIEDLLDSTLYEAASPFGACAKSTMLVVSERDVLALAEADARDRLRSLRANGFTIVARVGTDIAGLTSVGLIVPSYALLGVAAFGESGPVVTRVVAAVVAACREASVRVIADVATPLHASCARDTGCALAVGPGIVPGALA